VADTPRGIGSSFTGSVPMALESSPRLLPWQMKGKKMKTKLQLPVHAAWVLAAAMSLHACNSGGGSRGKPAESEPNDTPQTADYLGPAGGTYSITGTIGAATDEDFFSVDALAGTVLTIDLANLPANYDVELYDSVGTLILSSTNASTTDEQIVHAAPAAELYYVFVFGAGGAFDAAQSYVLTVAVPQGGALDPSFGTNGIIRVNPDPGLDDMFNDGVVDVANGFMYLVGGAGDGTGTNSLWRIEKRLLSDGSLVPGFGNAGVVLSDPNPLTDGLEEALALAIDPAGDRMYIAGGEVSVVPNTNWRVEKRLLSTGALDISFGPAGTGVWGSGPSTDDDQPTAIAIDGTWMYIAGHDEQLGAGNRQWRIEKWSLATAQLDGSFGAAGVVLSSPAGDEGGPADIAIDVAGNLMYVAGSSTAAAGDLQWHVEKRSLSTGAGIAAFGAAGLLPIDHSTEDDELRSLAIDAAAGFAYLVGDDGSKGGFDRQWRVEKRQLADGALVGAFGTGGTILVDHGAGFDIGLNACLEDGNLYVSGLSHLNPPFPRENFRIQIEKRDAATGTLVASFGSGGVVIEDPTQFADGLAVLGADATHIYLVGVDGLGFVSARDAGWRVEKRTK
jgi:hypothetical protein